MANDIDNPRRNQVAHYNGPNLAPRHVPNNPIDRVLTRFDARGRTHTLNTLTEQAEAGTRYVRALTDGARSVMAYMEVQAEIADMPAKFAHRAAVSLENRKAEFEEALHRRKLAHLRHEQAEAIAEAEIQSARVLLADVYQQLEAQRKYGAFTHELKHKKQQLEALGLTLEEAEMRKLLNGGWSSDSEPDPEIDDVLQEHRDALASANLDTSRVDKILNARKRK